MSRIVCSFAGHREIFDSGTKDKIKKVAQKLIKENGVNEFWVGNYGRFDACAALAIRELKDESYPDIELVLVIPYVTKVIEEYKDLYSKNYDGILISDMPLNTPRQFKIIKNNEFMVENADFIICYIDHTWGGAYKTYSYAKRKKKEIFNVAENAVDANA